MFGDSGTRHGSFFVCKRGERRIARRSTILGRGCRVAIAAGVGGDGLWLYNDQTRRRQKKAG